jgi:5-methylcytosine-specific restriction endonuclease McrA
VRAVSKAKAKELREYAPIRNAALERDEFTCQAPADWPHGGGIVVHHVVLRSRDGELSNDIDNLKTVCSKSHEYAHLHPAEATRVGLMRSAPASRPSGPKSEPK